MEISEHIEALRREGALLADAAERSGPGAAVPPCPGWVVRDVVRHTGQVHRWAAAYVLQGLRKPMSEAEELAVYGPMPDDADLLPWFAKGHTRLVGALESAKPDLECWTFLKAPSPLAFWARRQAHETAIHRVDAECAAGGTLSPFHAAFAADGIDELLTGFHTRRRSRVRTDHGPRVLGISATDAGAEWFAHLSVEAPPRVTREPEGAVDCTLSGPAGALYVALWNRGPRDALLAEGDTSLLDLWTERSAITWS